MFTGIVKGLGTVVSIEDRQAFRVLTLDAGDLVLAPVLGGSVAVNGVCLTIVEINGSLLTFEVMHETLKRTTFAYLRVGEKVGLETPLRMGDELGGHLVQGHVDGMAQILEKEQIGENTQMRFWVSADIGRQILHKGSVTLDGVSLTVCDPEVYPKDSAATVSKKMYSFSVWLLPLTLERTTLGHKIVGEKVNVEVDYLLKAVLSRVDAWQAGS